MSITFSPQGKSSELDINMSNTNARAIMDLLDIEVDYCGTIKSTDLIAKIDAVVSVQSHVQQPFINEEEGCATIIFCGRDEKYIKQRLQQLRTLAVEYPGNICWG